MYQWMLTKPKKRPWNWLRALKDQYLFFSEHSQFTALVTEEEHKAYFHAFREATSNNALSSSVCVVCARELWSHKGSEHVLLDVPNIRHRLIPSRDHPAYQLWNGILVVNEEISANTGRVCDACFRALKADQMPKYSLANNLWIGDHGMTGNVTLYNMNTEAIVQMLEGQLMPQSANQLASVLAVTYIGRKRLPKNWLRSTFRVRRRVVYEALMWLKKNNVLYRDIEISPERLESLPEDDIPLELSAIIRHEPDEDVGRREKEGYVPEDDEYSYVIPLQSLGVRDTELDELSIDERMKYALANLQEQEGGYVIRYGNVPISEFGSGKGKHQAPLLNPLAAAYPVLFPYGIGGVEEKRELTVGFDEHIRWALQFYDRRLRIQMNRRGFERDALLLSSLTIADLKQAEKEEASHKPISNTRCRAAYRGQIWGTCLQLRGPSLWITLNPCDLHDPVLQVFAGEDIDVDAFERTMGPDKNKRALNVARDPYASTKYFFFIINAILSTLFGIEVTRDQIHSTGGVLGKLSGYFGVVEAQGRGSLHVHVLLWLKDAPNSETMHSLLQTEAFRDRIRSFMKMNVCAHVDGLTEATIKTMSRETDLAYSRPPNPDSPHWNAEFTDRLCRVVRSQQVHTCTKSACLRYNTRGQLTCKRRAPWPLSGGDSIDSQGNYTPRRTVPYIHTFCPSISVAICCSSDIQVLTNGRDAKDATFLYHQGDSEHMQNVTDRNRMLIFRCQRSINRQMELSAPQVISYLMKRGDGTRSHHYVPLYWSSLRSALLSVYDELRPERNR
ncbi:hypothetical protein L210DRAFT_3615050 [Boletus edulis BED1]|uniref:Helitron helicase-like domain-containing protein n=1 Tax=Boletus edulis BED1 TaxID=1328754 RepID=A0AAD4G7Z4_BOLED|nr:hypothetical protein L210DRAFT_3615050 [Boletus edulis BED1]